MEGKRKCAVCVVCGVLTIDASGSGAGEMPRHARIESRKGDGVTQCRPQHHTPLAEIVLAVASAVHASYQHVCISAGCVFEIVSGPPHTDAAALRSAAAESTTPIRALSLSCFEWCASSGSRAPHRPIASLAPTRPTSGDASTDTSRAGHADTTSTRPDRDRARRYNHFDSPGLALLLRAPRIDPVGDPRISSASPAPAVAAMSSKIVFTTRTVKSIKTSRGPPLTKEVGTGLIVKLQNVSTGAEHHR